MGRELMMKTTTAKSEMLLYPFEAVLADANAQIGKGASVYQQFNCAGCGVKQTMEDENLFHSLGKCEQCGYITDIKRDGCNYMAMFNADN
jgi:hypothetical protein